jgi:ABC-type phosphate/phosphonate transport system permease subunit
MEESQTKSSVKDNWLKEDIKCEKCGQVVYKQKGITKQSIKKLFSFDWKNPQEYIWTIVIIGILLLAWSYMQEKKAYNDFMLHRTQYCTQLLSDIEYNTNGLVLNGSMNEMNISNFETNNTSLWNT